MKALALSDIRQIEDEVATSARPEQREEMFVTEPEPTNEKSCAPRGRSRGHRGNNVALFASASKFWYPNVCPLGSAQMPFRTNEPPS